MKKRNSVWVALMLAFGLSGAASAAPTALLPTQIPVSPDSQVRVAFSNSEPNLLVVPGDRIVSIESAQGMLIGGNQKGVEGHLGGSVVLMTTQTKPFTFYVRTAGGLTVSVVAVPEKRDGRVLQLVSNQPAKSPSAKRWEQSLPYPRLLTHIHKALLNGEPPDGFLAAPVTPLPALPLPVGLRYQADQMWNGGELRVYKLSVTNTTARSLTMTERLFHGVGVRSVVVFPYSETVLPGATATVWLTVSNEVGHG